MQLSVTVDEAELIRDAVKRFAMRKDLMGKLAVSIDAKIKKALARR